MKSKEYRKHLIEEVQALLDHVKKVFEPFEMSYGYDISIKRDWVESTIYFSPETITAGIKIRVDETYSNHFTLENGILYDHQTEDATQYFLNGLTITFSERIERILEQVLLSYERILDNVNDCWARRKQLEEFKFNS